MNQFKFCLIVAFLAVLFFACKKDTVTAPPAASNDTTKVEVTPPPTIDTANVIVNFNAMANGKNLVLSTGSYTNTSEDTFTVTKFNYYISNVKLIREDGFVFVEPESYHIIKHADGLNSFAIRRLPTGRYNKIEFLIGVDSVRNVSGIQSGALDVSHGMFWEWNSGYIFFKLEGTYASYQVPKDGEYAIHIGGFSGKFKCLQNYSATLATPIVSKDGKTSRLTFNTNIDEIFNKPKVIGFDTYYASVTDAMFKDISENYKDMFSVAKVEN